MEEGRRGRQAAAAAQECRAQGGVSGEEGDCRAGAMTPGTYDNSVFLNCPFDATYRPLFEAVTFAVYDCGFQPRCALEIDDGSQVRIDKITSIIAQCRLAVHDI
jgi:hypothetical protein